MSVRINDLCISCDACLDECPTSSIVDGDDNPTGEEYYYIHPETCTECIGDHDSPACQDACPIEDCIVWDVPYDEENRAHFEGNALYKIEENADNDQPFHKDVSMDVRKAGDVESIIE